MPTDSQLVDGRSPSTAPGVSGPEFLVGEMSRNVEHDVNNFGGD